MSSARLLIPFFPTEKEVFFRGYVFLCNQNALTIYIVNFFTNPSNLFDMDTNSKQELIYGYWGKNIPFKKLRQSNNYIVINQNEHSIPQLNKLIYLGKEINIKQNCIFVLYNFKTVKESQIMSNTDDYIVQLRRCIQEDSGEQKQVSTYKPLLQINNWLSSSMFLQYIVNYINLSVWLLTTLKRERKVSIKHGNLILSILADLLLGYVLMQYLSQDTKEMSSFLMGVLEKLINSLYTLLKWLMGAPVGLKLNNAFNKMMGKYFSYHVQLWWLFLDVSGEKLDIILYVYSYLGYLGVTFQTAVISDMISIATFHSYCIYVYAARLFNMQISGLIALLRLFVGRKHNPLRGGIDSCEYTNQELFVGTVAFTILLLLLPTTTMYYIVFTLLRILSLMVQYILGKFIYIVQTLPLYVLALWLTQSPKVSGNIVMEVVSDEDHSPLVLRMKCFSKSLQELVDNLKPPVEVPNTVEWTNLISNVLRGKQIV
ncbi:hypothetical protein K1T71_007234 [Dendrolimus kikuchii]|uniref:Uncharacterized protein n=1 Tax=Dendrolimus kikuchii TaxID=765133 RepID=A0ACC1D028_9NEOP|nr:hypothetical protein K1T71_007234 [Dendrolimus kikuchii]